MIFAVALLLLVLAGVVLGLRAVGNLTLRLDGLAGQIAADAEKNLGEHRISRAYIGNELIEKRVLPTIGWRPEPEAPTVTWMKGIWQKEVLNTDERE